MRVPNGRPLPPRPAETAALQRFAARVRDRRVELGMSQGEFAERCGKHRTYISSVERGRRNIALVNVLRLAKALDVDPTALLDGLTLRAEARTDDPRWRAQRGSRAPR